MPLPREIFLEPSTAESDGGSLVGRDPRKIPAEVYIEHGVSNRGMKAIRAKCLDCSGGSPAEARKCTAIDCALWPFRMGRKPYSIKSDQDGDDDAAVLDEILPLDPPSTPNLVEINDLSAPPSPGATVVFNPFAGLMK